MSDGSELATQRSMIANLRDELRSVKNEVTQLAAMRQSLARLDSLPDQVTALTDRVSKVEELLAQIHQQQVLNANLDQARDERIRLENRLRDEFAGRNEIRRLAVSLISSAGSAAIRSAVIDPQTVIDTAGQHMLKDADFWLAPAVIAVAAEQLGHDGTSPAAWSLSATSDMGKSDLFMSLFCSLLRRHDVAAMSMNRYLEALEPHALGREFSHVINALAEGELGPEAMSYAQEALNRWGHQMLDVSGGESAYDAQFRTCRNHLLTYHEPLPDAFSTIRLLAVRQWKELEETWPYAVACRVTARTFQERFAEDDPAERSPARHMHSQRALRQLIDQSEEDEIEVRRLIRTQELIMQCGGDRKRAEVLANELGDPYATISDLATFLTQATFEPDAYGLGPAAQRFALACATNWIMGAGQSISVEAAEHRPSTMTFRWDGWEDRVEVEKDADAEVARLTDAVCGYVAETRRARPPTVVTTLCLIGGILLPFAGILLMQGSWEWILGVAGVSTATGAGVDFATYPSRRARATRDAEAEQELVRRTMPTLVEESQTLLRLWDATAEQGIHELATTLNVVATPQGG